MGHGDGEGPQGAGPRRARVPLPDPVGSDQADGRRVPAAVGAEPLDAPPRARRADVRMRPAVPDRNGGATGPNSVRRLTARFGLSARLLILTVNFVMVAEVLIYVPSVANFRRNWLTDRLAAARVTALVFEAAPGERLSADLEARLLESVGALAIVVRGGGIR